jgi:hypothetical protein
MDLNIMIDEFIEGQLQYEQRMDQLQKLETRKVIAAHLYYLQISGGENYIIIINLPFKSTLHLEILALQGELQSLRDLNEQERLTMMEVFKQKLILATNNWEFAIVRSTGSI